MSHIINDKILYEAGELYYSLLGEVEKIKNKETKRKLNVMLERIKRAAERKELDRLQEEMADLYRVKIRIK